MSATEPRGVVHPERKAPAMTPAQHRTSPQHRTPAPHGPVNRTHSRVDIMGVHISCVNMRRAVSLVEECVDGSRHGYVCVSDANALLHARDDRTLRDVLNDSLLTVPDGMPLVWSGRWAGSQVIDRVPGPELMPAVLRLSAERGWSNYFLGGDEETMTALIGRLEENIPGLQVAGRHCPPFRALSEEEDERIVRDINASGATFLWVGLGAPKQEAWLGSHNHRLTVPVAFGVGGAFAMNAGTVGRAPRWMQRSGLEWSYRLLQEPKRLWPRYSKVIPRFLAGIVGDPPHLLTGPSRDPGARTP